MKNWRQFVNMMGRLSVIPSNIKRLSCILIGCIFYGMVSSGLFECQSCVFWIHLIHNRRHDCFHNLALKNHLGTNLSWELSSFKYLPPWQKAWLICIINKKPHWMLNTVSWIRSIWLAFWRNWKQVKTKQIAKECSFIPS
jgi:hypothetical protein